MSVLGSQATTQMYLASFQQSGTRNHASLLQPVSTAYTTTKQASEVMVSEGKLTSQSSLLQHVNVLQSGTVNHVPSMQPASAIFNRVQQAPREAVVAVAQQGPRRYASVAETNIQQTEIANHSSLLQPVNVLQTGTANHAPSMQPASDTLASLPRHSTPVEEKSIQAKETVKTQATEVSVPQEEVERGTLVLAPIWVQKKSQELRTARLGLNDPIVHAFCQTCEFVSLGNFCGAAFALQALGLKRYSYPFDWVRSPAVGIIKCVQTNFANFLSHSYSRDQIEYPIQMFGGSTWGGSFWHHRIQEEQVREEFTRRIDRFYSRREEVPASMPRVFVRVANSSQELGTSADLLQTLRAHLPGSKVHLLVIIDLQKTPGLVYVDTLAGAGLLFYRVPETLYANRDMHHTERMKLNGEGYAEGIALAIRTWAGKTDIPCYHMPSLEHFEATCDPFDGGCPSNALYDPQPLQSAIATSSLAVATTISKGVAVTPSQARAQIGSDQLCNTTPTMREQNEAESNRKLLETSVFDDSIDLSSAIDHCRRDVKQLIAHGSYVSDVSTSATSDPDMLSLGSFDSPSMNIAHGSQPRFSIRQPPSVMNIAHGSQPRFSIRQPPSVTFKYL